MVACINRAAEDNECALYPPSTEKGAGQRKEAAKMCTVYMSCLSGGGARARVVTFKALEQGNLLESLAAEAKPSTPAQRLTALGDRRQGC